ncbi:unnamed protein product [Ambrosiozyma monospora]|uniref:Unnamed protein product n=1 Tax=Ambrosiozyma monospora TaxID=43982 RepID=A0ACB5TJQ2_AMBMO|nr:unnamed protein product [Ambrosiozyma monospora]
MRLSTSILFSLAASTALAAPIASDFTSSTTSSNASASTPSSSAAIDLNDPVQKQIFGLFGDRISGYSATHAYFDLGDTASLGEKVKRELQSTASASVVYA